MAVNKVISVKEAVFWVVTGFFLSWAVYTASIRTKEIELRNLQTNSDILSQSKVLSHKLRTQQSLSTGSVNNLSSKTGKTVAVNSEKTFTINSVKNIKTGKNCKGVWIDRTSLPLNRKECEELISKVASMGMTAIFPEVFSRTVAVCYNSSVAPHDQAFNHGNDILKVLIEEAHKQKIEVHGWCWCMCAGTAWKPGQKVIEKSHWLATNLQGKMVSQTGSFWLCPLSKGGNQYLIDVFSELVSNYDLDGINLDYIRVEENDKAPFCMCSRCRKSWFSWVSKNKTAVWPPPPRSPQYLQWKEGLLDGFMGKVAHHIGRLNKKAALSACILPLENRAKRLEAQHWKAWFTEGYLDFACALTYTDRLYRKRKWNELLKEYKESKMRIFPSVGLHLCKENPHRALALINASEKANLGGVMLFSLRDITSKVEKALNQKMLN